MINLNDFVEIISKPKYFFSSLNEKAKVRDNIHYLAFLSLVFYLLYMALIYLRFLNNDLNFVNDYYSLLFETPFNLWMLLYFSLAFLTIFIGLVFISLALAFGLYIILIYFYKKKSVFFNRVWQICVFCLTPLILESLLALFLYILNVELLFPIKLSFLSSIYIFVLLYLGMKSVK